MNQRPYLVLRMRKIQILDHKTALFDILKQVIGIENSHLFLLRFFLGHLMQTIHYTIVFRNDLLRANFGRNMCENLAYRCQSRVKDDFVGKSSAKAKY